LLFLFLHTIFIDFLFFLFNKGKSTQESSVETETETEEETDTEHLPDSDNSDEKRDSLNNTTETEKEPAKKKDTEPKVNLDFSGNGFCTDNVHCEVISQMQKEIKQLRARVEDQEQNMKAVENYLFYENVPNTSTANGKKTTVHTTPVSSSLYNDLVQQMGNSCGEMTVSENYIRFNTVDYSTLDQNQVPASNVEFEYVNEMDILPRVIKSTHDLDQNNVLIHSDSEVVLLDLDSGKVMATKTGDVERQETQPESVVQNMEIRGNPDGEPYVHELQQNQTIDIGQAIQGASKTQNVTTCDNSQTKQDMMDVQNSGDRQNSQELSVQDEQVETNEHKEHANDTVPNTGLEQNYSVVPVSSNLKGILAKKTVSLFLLKIVLKTNFFNII